MIVIETRLSIGRLRRNADGDLAAARVDVPDFDRRDCRQGRNAVRIPREVRTMRECGERQKYCTAVRARRGDRWDGSRCCITQLASRG